MIKEMVFIGGTNDGLRRLVHDHQKYIHLLIDESRQIKPIENEHIEGTKVVYHTETYKRESLIFGDDKEEPDQIEHVDFFILTTINVLDAFKMLLERY